MRLKSSFIFIGLVVLVVFYFLIDGALSLFRKGYIFRVWGQPVLILGVAHKIPKDQLVHYSPRLEQSFEKKTLDKISYKIARYEKNIFVDRVDEHTVYAKDAYTGENYRLLWTKDSAYACLNQPKVNLPEGEIDPSRQDLKGIEFVFFGSSWRGVLGDEGLNQLTVDLVPGDPAKLYLVNENKNSQGSLEVLQLILFTTRPSCIATKSVNVWDKPL